MKITAVDFLIKSLFGSIEICSTDFRHKIEQAKEIEKQQIGYNNEQMMEYAKFCIHCYNQGLPNIMPNDWKNLYENEQRNSI